jgi:hypothetical protein
MEVFIMTGGYKNCIQITKFGWKIVMEETNSK